MKKYLILLLTLCLAIALAGGAGAEEMQQEGALGYGELPADFREAFESQKAAYLAQLQSQAKSTGDLTVIPRGLVDGYSGSRSAGSLSIEYSINKSVVKVGEPIIIRVKARAAVTPIIYSVTGTILDDSYNKIGDVEQKSGYTVAKNYDIQMAFLYEEARFFAAVPAACPHGGQCTGC